jgi:hypothetical protein
MSKHREAAAEDRHPPVDYTFADEATRLVYSYETADVGNWYKQTDTGELWELLTVAPTFARVPASAAVFDLIVCSDNAVVCFENEVVYYE